MVALIGVICLLLFFILINRSFISKILLVCLFRVSITVMLLFVLNIIVNKIGVAVPINLFTVVVIALLKVPGAVCIGLLIFLKVFL
ncbi:MAG: pro-sigmaK processing inhibitor BofA family protein [Solibacillus sp.]